MKRRELQVIAKKYCLQHKAYSEKIPGFFSPEDIHDLRVGFKRLRAFMRLLMPEINRSEALGLPASLISLYHAAGIVRDLQVNIPVIKNLFAKYEFQTHTYDKQLEKHLFDAKEKLVKCIEQVSFPSCTQQIAKRITSDLDDTTINKFVHRKIATIQILLLTLSDDNDIHSIRKHLKDIGYAIRIFNHEWGISFPVVAWKSEKLLNDAATQLGNYNDQCIAISFLESAQTDELPGYEIDILQKLYQLLSQEKEQQMKKLSIQLHGLKLVSNF